MDAKSDETPANSGKTESSTGDPTNQSADEPPTDTGWSWVVLVAAFVVNFTAIGFIATMGIYVNVWMVYFEVSAASTSLAISVGSLLRGILSKNADIYFHLNFNASQNSCFIFLNYGIQL